MPVKEILRLGNPKLYTRSSVVNRSDLININMLVADMHDTMMNFRTEYGRGRAIAAQQIDVFKRVIYMNIDSPVVLINPEIKSLSEKTIEIWDDCMSFPELLVKVRRHKTCEIHYLDLEWQKKSMFLEDDLSELLQHEYDHLDGILAVQRAIDEKSFALYDQKDKIL